MAIVRLLWRHMAPIESGDGLQQLLRHLSPPEDSPGTPGSPTSTIESIDSGAYDDAIGLIHPMSGPCRGRYKA